jgi:hypothetical protein
MMDEPTAEKLMDEPTETGEMMGCSLQDDG